MWCLTLMNTHTNPAKQNSPVELSSLSPCYSYLYLTTFIIIYSPPSLLVTALASLWWCRWWYHVVDAVVALPPPRRSRQSHTLRTSHHLLPAPLLASSGTPSWVPLHPCSIDSSLHGEYLNNNQKQFEKYL